MQLQPTDCACAREFVSAQLDGELPELELDRLETHLLLCPECSNWAQQVRDVTLRLREAPLEAPAERFVLPRLRRGAWRVGSAVAVASAAAVVATMFVAPGQNGAAQNGIPQLQGNVGVTGKHFVMSRLVRLADGRPAPVNLNTSYTGFRHF